MSGAQALMDALRRHGVETIFGYPGGAILPIYDALHVAESEGWLRHYLVRHEQGGTHAADAYDTHGCADSGPRGELDACRHRQARRQNCACTAARYVAWSRHGRPGSTAPGQLDDSGGGVYG